MKENKEMNFGVDPKPVGANAQDVIDARRYRYVRSMGIYMKESVSRVVDENLDKIIDKRMSP